MAMVVDEQVESRLRAAYGAAIAKRADDVTAALDGITHEQSMTLIGLGLYVAGGHLLAHYRQENERWYRYLDAILDTFEAFSPSAN